MPASIEKDPERTSLPTGVVTFLLTDVEGSTRMWEAFPEQMRSSVAQLDALLPQLVSRHRGSLPKDQGEGDSMLAAFVTATDAVSCAIDIHRALRDAPWPVETPLKVRIGLHTGQAEVTHGNYRGPVINRAARLRGIAHGGQTVISETVRNLLDAESLDISVLDLGLHRLKDIPEPQHVFQIWAEGLEERFPPLVSLDPPTDNLLVALTSFVGRRDLMERVKEAVSSHRLVTLIGPGGSGKTRLAIETAADLIRDHPDGVWLIELAGVPDPSLIGQAVASVLGIKEQPGRPLGEVIVEHLRRRRTLLLYDNFEHLGAEASHFAQHLLESSRDLRILATGRQPLGISGEAIVPVPPLDLPPTGEVPDEELRSAESVQLFIDRASLVEPETGSTVDELDAIAEIVRRLDGLPLAIELAAAMVGVFSLEDLRKRLNSDLRLEIHPAGSEGRHHTLRATVQWSYDLLGDEERELLSRLSVFEGGFDLDAAEAIGRTRRVMSDLTQLVEKSMVVASKEAGRSRFGMLETVREFAREELAKSGDRSEAERLHLQHFRDLAKEASEGMRTALEREWMDRLEADHDNFRSALLSATSIDPVAGLEIASDLGRFWRLRGYPTEGRSHLTRLIGAATGAPPALRADALDELGEMMKLQGDFPSALDAFSESLRIRRELGDPRPLARSKLKLGSLAYARGDHTEAASYFQEVLDDRTGLPDEDVATAARGMGGVAYWRGEYDIAKRHFDSSMELLSHSSDQQAITQVHLSLGSVEFALGNHERAQALFEGSLEVLRASGDRLGVAACLVRIGAVQLAAGEFDAAKRVFEESLVIQRTLSDRQGEASSLHGLAVVARGQGDEAAAEILHLQALRFRSELQDAPHVALSLESYARFEAGRGRAERAAVLFGAAEALRDVLGSPILPADQQAHDASVGSVRSMLGQRFEPAFGSGRSMSMQQAVAYAFGADERPA